MSTNTILEVCAANAPLLLTVALVFLVVYRLGEQFKRVSDAVITGLTSQAQKNAAAYAMGFCYATAASLQALGEVATSLHWAYAAAAAKVLQPGIVAIIAYMNKAPTPSPSTPASSAGLPAGSTTPPFPPAQT